MYSLGHSLDKLDEQEVTTHMSLSIPLHFEIITVRGRGVKQPDEGRFFRLFESGYLVNKHVSPSSELH